MSDYVNYDSLTDSAKESRRKATKKFMANIDRLDIQLPKGTKQRIYNITGKSCNAYVRELVLADLERLEQLEQTNKEADDNKG
ncbi:MAG: hypothetical protein LUE88_07010 [Clostridiales bacterium]|nr:hypothetical protein [Clostridiales bacterium]